MISKYTVKPAWWIKWKRLRLPWRTKWLVGFDLNGNTFWEFKDQIQALRLRRIVHSRDELAHMSDLKLSPAWMQWLRHTRQHPPSILEQEQDVQRQRDIKMLARAADQRWEALAPTSTAPNSPPSSLPQASTVPLKSFSPPVSFTQDSTTPHPAAPLITVFSPSTTTTTPQTSNVQDQKLRPTRDSGPQPDAWVPRLGKR